jgi:hypothetical protein
MKVPKERDYSADPEVNGDNIRMNLNAVGREGVDWINLVQGRDRWPTVAKTLKSLRLL